MKWNLIDFFIFILLLIFSALEYLYPGQKLFYVAMVAAYLTFMVRRVLWIFVYRKKYIEKEKCRK